MERYVTSTAEELHKRGCTEKTIVAILLPNCWQYLVLLFALFRIGAVACPLSTRLPKESIRRRLKQIGSRLVISSDMFDPETDDLTVFPMSSVIRDGRTGITSPPPVFQRDRPLSIVFTSGSTGAPKAVLHTYGNHYYSALGSNKNIKLVAGDSWLLSLPLYHVGGMSIVFRCLLARAAIAVPEQGIPLHYALRHHEITHVSVVTTQLQRLLHDIQDDCFRLKAILLGGSAVEYPLVVKAHEQKLPIHTTYGLTEMTSQVTATPRNCSLTHLKTSGRVLPYRNVTIDDDGEILVKGVTLFMGYWTPAGIESPFDADGWFHTGDLGVADADGWLTVYGRKDFMFISGGENIHPEEIEHFLKQVPGVTCAVVVSVPDKEFGFRPVAFLRKTRASLSPAVIVRYLEDVIPRYKIPVAFYDWPPDSNSGEMKINRRSLEEKARSLYKLS